MLTVALSFGVGVLIGLIVGGGLGFWLARRKRTTMPPLDYLDIDPAIDGQITAASRAWASAQGVPEAAGLAGDKLRLLYAVQQRKANRKRGT